MIRRTGALTTCICTKGEPVTTIFMEQLTSDVQTSQSFSYFIAPHLNSPTSFTYIVSFYSCPARRGRWFPRSFEWTAPFYTNRPFVHSKPLNQLTETVVFFELLSRVKGHVYTNPGKKNTGVSKNCVRVDGGLTCFTSDKQNNFFLAFLQVIAYKSS